MQVTEFAFKFLILFFPGILAFLIIETLAVTKAKDNLMFFVHSFVLSIFSYCTYDIIINTLNYLSPTNFSGQIFFFQNIGNNTAPINVWEIFLVSIVAIFIGIISAFVINNKLIFRFFKYIRITKKFADLDVWSHVMNSEQEALQWVTIRDIENNVTYVGWIEAFSDTHDKCEIFIKEVIAYASDTAEELYQTGALYLSREAGKITLEFDKFGIEEFQNPELGIKENIKKEDFAGTENSINNPVANENPGI